MGNIQGKMKNILKTTLILAIFAVSLNLSARTRVAIVSENYGKLEDLLTAELSNLPDIELLNRSEIRKILKEQKIATQIIDSKKIFSLGKILKTDLFVVIQKDKNHKQPIGLIIFDAHTGIRYWNIAFPEDDIEKAVKFTNKATQQACKKHKKAIGGKLRYVSLLPIKNVDLPRDKNLFCKAVGIILLQKLGDASDFAILERDHLDWLVKEQSLFHNMASLIGSNFIISIEISRDEDKTGNNHVKSSISLFPTPKIIATTSGNISQPGELANNLAIKFSEYLNLKIKFPQNTPEVEAELFFKEYCWANKSHQYQKALNYIETAYALNPDKRHYENALQDALVKSAFETLIPSGITHNTSTIVRSFQQQTKALDKLDRGMNITQKNNSLASSYLFRNLFKKLARKQKYFRSTNKEQIMELYQTYLQANKKYYAQKEQEILKENPQKKVFDLYSYFLHKLLTDRSLFLSDDIWYSSLFPAIKQWIYCLESAKKANPKWSPTSDPFFRKTKVIIKAFYKNIAKRKRKNLSPANKKFLNGLVGYCKKSSLKEVRFLFVKETSATKGKNIAWNAYTETLIQINQCPKDAKLEDIASIYNEFHSRLWKHRDTDVILGLALCEFMLERNEIVEIFFTRAINGASYKHSSFPKLLQVIDKTIAVLQNKNPKIDQQFSNPNTFINNLFEKKQRIFQTCPELREKIEEMPWEKVIELVKNRPYSKEQGYLQIKTFTFDKDFIYVLCEESDKLYFKCFSHQGKFIKNTSPFSNPKENSFAIFEAKIQGEKIWLKTAQGFLIYSLKEGNIKKLNMNSGLPSNKIRHFTFMDNFLYAVLGKSPNLFIISYNLDNNKISTIASSNRKEELTPFDNHQCHYIEKFIPIKNKRSLLIGNRGMLWIFNIPNSQWTPLWDNLLRPAPIDTFYSLRPNHANNLLVFSQANAFLAYNPETNSFWSKYDINARFHKKEHISSLGSPLLPIGDWIWVSNPFSRISIHKKDIQYLNHPNQHINFFADSINLIAPKKVIVRGQYHIWLILLKKYETKIPRSFIKLTQKNLYDKYYGPARLNSYARNSKKRLVFYSFRGSSGHFCNITKSLTSFYRKELPEKVKLISETPEGLNVILNEENEMLTIVGKIPLVDGKNNKPFELKITLSWEE